MAAVGSGGRTLLYSYWNLSYMEMESEIIPAQTKIHVNHKPKKSNSVTQIRIEKIFFTNDMPKLGSLTVHTRSIILTKGTVYLHRICIRSDF